MKLENIDVKKQTIFIPDSISKDRKDALITLPEVVLDLLNELKIMQKPHDCYIFGKDFETCRTIGHNKMFSNYWDRFIVSDKGLLPQLKGKHVCFYSLKGTGITKMLKSGVASIAVRDQARHQHITTTEIYAQRQQLKAPEVLKNYK